MLKMKLLFTLKTLLLFIPIIAFAKDIKFTNFQTKDGVRVLFFQDKSLPMVDVSFSLKAGSVHDVKDKKGQAALVATMLGKATKYKTELQIAQDFEKFGAIYKSNISKDKAEFSLRSLSKSEVFPKTLNNFINLFKSHLFDAKILKREKNNLIKKLIISAQKPRYLANKIMLENLYPHHNYRFPIWGNPRQSIKNISIKDLKRFYNKYYVKENLTINIVGDISVIAAKAVAEKISKSFKSGKKAEPVLEPEQVQKNKTIEKNIKTPQARYIFATLGVNRKNKDYPEFLVLNSILGGNGLNTKLMQSLREDNGLTYGVYSYFDKLEVAGPWQISFATKNSNIPQANKLLQKVFSQFPDSVTEAEFKDAKVKVIGNLLLSTRSNKDILEYMSLINFYDLPLDYLTSLPERIAAVDFKDSKEIWRQFFQDKKFIKVIVKGSATTESSAVKSEHRPETKGKSAKE